MKTDLSGYAGMTDVGYGIRVDSDWLVFMVNSDESDTPPWRVDLEAFGGFGRCNCWDLCRHWKKDEPSKLDRIKAGERTYEAACKHMRRVHFLCSMAWAREKSALRNKNKPSHQSDAERNE